MTAVRNVHNESTRPSAPRSVWATIRLVLAAACVLLPFAIRAESPTAGATPVGVLGLTDRQDFFKPEDDFYLRYCAPTDSKIVLAYVDRWRYHETQLPYVATSWNYEHLSIASIDA